MESFLIFIFPIALPVLMVVILMLMSNDGRLDYGELPSRTCYAALTFDVWLVSTIASGQKVRVVHAQDAPWQAVVIVVLIHVALTVVCTLSNPAEPISQGRVWRNSFFGLLSLTLAAWLRY